MHLQDSPSFLMVPDSQVRIIDLRSDTVTRPTPAMRAAMAAAEVGDDVFGEDPTVNRLQAMLAERLGKEAGLFVASGTQSNLIALMSHCERGDEFIAGQRAHVYMYEAGGGAVLGGVAPQPITVAEDGTLPLESIEAVIKPDDFHFARTRLVCIENTFSGRVLPPGYVESLGAFCSARRLALHMDGARFFNACVASGRSAAEMAAPCDSISLCLSKGLGAPVGSVLVGSADLISRARRLRKMLGGGMRQAGILAAAGLYALGHHVDRLVEDHRRAAALADSLGNLFPGRVEQYTNMIHLNLPDAELKPFLAHMNKSGVQVHRPRWVMHLDVNDDDLQYLQETVRRYVG